MKIGSYVRIYYGACRALPPPAAGLAGCAGAGGSSASTPPNSCPVPLGRGKAIARARATGVVLHQSGGFKLFEVLRNRALGKGQRSHQLAAGTRSAGRQQAHDGHAGRMAEGLGEGRHLVLLGPKSSGFVLIHAVLPGAHPVKALLLASKSRRSGRDGARNPVKKPAASVAAPTLPAADGQAA